jgi:hypothetical protein
MLGIRSVSARRRRDRVWILEKPTADEGLYWNVKALPVLSRILGTIQRSRLSAGQDDIGIARRNSERGNDLDFSR